MAEVARVPPPEQRWSPLGVGLLVFGERAADADRALERLAVAMAAYAAGVFLVDTLEIDLSRDGGQADSVYSALWLLAVRTDSEVVFVRGPVNRARVEAMADEVRMVIRDVDGP
jgi:hypothetical protein